MTPWPVVNVRYGMTPVAARVLSGNTFGAVVLLPDSRRILIGGHRVELTAAMYALMALLVEIQGRTATREALFQTVLGRAPRDGDRNMDQLVFAIRLRLDRVPGGAGLIGAVRGQGYFLRDAI